MRTTLWGYASSEKLDPDDLLKVFLAVRESNVLALKARPYVALKRLQVVSRFLLCLYWLPLALGTGIARSWRLMSGREGINVGCEIRVVAGQVPRHSAGTRISIATRPHREGA